MLLSRARHDLETQPTFLIMDDEDAAIVACTELITTSLTSVATLTMANKKLIGRWDSERELFYGDTSNHFYAVRPKSYQIRWNNAK